MPESNCFISRIKLVPIAFFSFADAFKILHLATTVEDVGVFEEAVRSGKYGINQLFLSVH